MSHVDTSQLSAYNSLSDKHLAGYFANDRMRGHLRKSGLITRKGQIVSETSYRLNIARKEHKKHVKDLLAQAIVHKTLDLERHRQVAIRQKLEEIAKIELVQRVRTQRVRRSDEDILPFLSPRSSRPQSGPSPRPRRSAKYRPISAPSNMPDTNSSMYESIEEDGDVTYVDDEGNTIDMSDCEQGVVRPGRSRTPRSREEVDTRHLYSLNPLALRRYANALAKVEQVNTLASPYLIPQIPIPPSSPRTGPTRHRSAGNRGRSTSSDKSPKRSPGVDLHRKEPPMRHQGDVHSNCMVTMKFHGWVLKLARERTDNRHDVTVEQQHCGGNTLTVFKGLIEPGSTFSFTSKRHRGYPFSLTLYVDGRQDARVSTCCEFGHSKKVRLGAKQGHFSFVGIKGMNPCYKCQVQKGLVGGKAPPKKVKRPPSNPGEEVIVVKTTEVPPKEIENTKDSDEEESDAYESDFEDEDDTPSGRSQQPDEVLYHKDWDSQGNQQEALEEPIAEEQEEEEDKRQIRGLADDFADDEKGDEKNAFVSAEQSANPDVVEHFEDDTLRKVEGYSSEEEDLDGKKDKTIVVEKKLADSGSSSVDSSSDSSATSGSSSEMESESEGELIVQEETPRGLKDTSPQTDDSASREDAAPKTVTDASPAVVSTDISGGDRTKTEDSDSEEPQQTNLPAPHATPQPEQTTFPSPSRSLSKSHPAEQTEQVPPPVPTVVVIPTTPDIREGQGSGEWQDQATTPVQGPRQTGGLPAQFEYQPKHSTESDEKTGEDGQTRRASESETENMHGGNDPDKVADDDDAAKWQSVLEFVQPPPQTMHPGSLTPLLEDQNAIDINNINLTKAQVVEIMQTIEIKDNLQAVTISNCSLGVDEMNKLLQSLAKSPSNPRILNLNNNILGPRSVVPLVEILKIKPSIDMLLLQGNPIGNEGLQTLVDGLLDIEFEAQEYKKRESEQMGGVPVMSIKGRFCQLQELDLSETSITDDGMVDVALLLESNLDLHTLSLSSCPDITNPGWSKLAAALAKNKNLKTLTIQNNKICDEGVCILVEGLKKNTSLSTLEVANAGIEEAGGRALIDLLKRNTTVQYLTLGPGNDIPQKTLDEINRYLSLNHSPPSSKQ